MRKPFHYLVAGLTCIGLTFASCDDNSSGTPPPPGSEYANFPYSKLTPAQQKEKLAAEANAFINQLKDLNNQQAIEVIEAFYNLLRISEELPDVGGSAITSAPDIFRVNDFYGTFAWNANTRTWRETASTGALTFNFPVGNQNSRIVVSGVSSNVTGEFDGVTVQLPKELSAKIYLGNTEVGQVQLSADVVNANSIPNSANMSFGLGAYTFTQSAKKDGNATATLKKGNTTLMSLSALLDGGVEQLGESEELSGNFVIRMMGDLAFVGNVDYAGYAKAMRELDNQYILMTEEMYVKSEVEIWNKYYDIYLVSTKEGTRIAKLIQKAILESDTYNSWVYNPNTGSYDIVPVTYTYWNTVEYLRFNDQTEVEASVYFSEGFATVLDNFENFIKLFQ